MVMPLVSDVWSLLGTVRLSLLRTLLLMALLNILELNSKSSYLCLIPFSSSWADSHRCFKLGSSETFLCETFAKTSYRFSSSSRAPPFYDPWHKELLQLWYCSARPIRKRELSLNSHWRTKHICLVKTFYFCENKLMDITTKSFIHTVRTIIEAMRFRK